MQYLSVCSGIEAATVAWHPLGWKAKAFAEIKQFQSAVLDHHYPEVPNYGDMTKYKEWNIGTGIDILVGGTPCQSFSVAGLRGGLKDPRGNLMLTYGAIADHFRPSWIVWENVPGVLSSNKGRDFGTFLGMLAELGYGFAYRILDAQYYGVAQRRRRVFVVGYLGDWRRAAQVLFESKSMCGHTPPSREAGQGFAEIAGTLAANGDGTTRPAGNCNELDFCVPVAPALTASGRGVERTGESRGQDPVVVVEAPILAFPERMSATQVAKTENISPALMSTNPTAVAFDGYNQTLSDTCQTLRTDKSDGEHIGMIFNSKVRRLTPIECERLQGFPDNYTRIPYRGKMADNCPDGPRYKALGNSMAVPVMRWVGDRIQAICQ